MSDTPSPSQNNYNDRGRAKGSVWGLTTNKSRVTFTDITFRLIYRNNHGPWTCSVNGAVCISLRPPIEIYQKT